jgi:hypothetical protein
MFLWIEKKITNFPNFLMSEYNIVKNSQKAEKKKAREQFYL